MIYNLIQKRLLVLSKTPLYMRLENIQDDFN
jgi:hypothetical protein